MKPALTLLIGDDEFRGIGHVAAQWAYLETQVDYLIDILINQPETLKIGLTMQQAFKRRMDTLRTAAGIVLEKHPAELSELMDIAQKISSLRSLRDDVVHGHWKLHRRRGTGKLETGIRIANRGRKLVVREEPFSAQKAESVAAKISVENLRLMLWCQAHIQ